MLLDPSHASLNTSIIEPGRGNRWTTGSGQGEPGYLAFHSHAVASTVLTLKQLLIICDD